MFWINELICRLVEDRQQEYSNNLSTQRDVFY